MDGPQSTSLLLVDPSRGARLRRLLRGLDAPVRAEWIDANANRRRVVASLLDPPAERAVRADPLVGRSRCIALAGSGDAWRSGAIDRLDLGPHGSLRRLPGSSPVTDALSAPFVVVTPSRVDAPDIVDVVWPLRRSLHEHAVCGLFLPRTVARHRLERWRRDRKTAWASLRAYEVEAGWVILDVRPSPRDGAIAIPLWRHSCANGARVRVEVGLAVPAAMEALALPAGEWLAIVRCGAVDLMALDGAPRPLSDWFDWRAREIVATPARGAASGSSVEEEDPRSAATATHVTRWLSEPDTDDDDARTLDVDDGDDDERGSDGDERASRVDEADPSEARRGGWLRHFVLRALPEDLRRRLDSRSRRDVKTTRGRVETVQRQGILLGSLLAKLRGGEWRDALRLALPLRAPGDKEPPARWLNSTPALGGVGTDFSLDVLAAKGELGTVGIGNELWRRFEAVYRQLGERLVAARRWRPAAHVFSYLLGDHARAGAVLEAGGHALEAATVFHHLADNPRRAAVALGRGGMWSQAARVWMDTGDWQHAAEAWTRANDEVQAHAAWRKVAHDLRGAGRAIEAARVFERRLGELSEAVDILEAAVLALDNSWLEAFAHALVICVDSGDAPRGREIVSRGVEAVLSAADGDPRRVALKRLLVLTERLATWACDGARLQSVVEDRMATSVWRRAVNAWGGARPTLPHATQRELDARCLDATRAHALRVADRWVVHDVERWLAPGVSASATSADPAGAVDSPRRAARPPERHVELAHDATALALTVDRVFVGTRDGSVRAYDRALEGTGRLETGAGRPVARLAARGVDVYAAVGSEVHHFDLEHSSVKRRGPLQIERAIGGEVHGLACFPDGVAVLRVATSAVHVLHPSHLRPMSCLLDAGRRHAIIDACANRRHVAALIHQLGRRGEPTGVFQILVLLRQRVRSATEVKEVERFRVESRHPRRLAFVDQRDDDDLFVVGDEFLTWLPARREAVRAWELRTSSLGGQLPPARVGALRRRGAAVIAYGDGAVEQITLETGERELLEEEPRASHASLDPMVGMEVDETAKEVWLLHASGKVRIVGL